VKTPFVIGISGSIGSGKSLVRHLLALRGVLTIDADELTHLLMLKGKAGYMAVLQIFGDRILTSDGAVERGKLGQIVFHDPQELQKLEEAIHPLVAKTVRAILQQTTCPLVAIEAIKLYSSELLSFVNSRWFITASREVQFDRLAQTRGMSREMILERVNQQPFPQRLQIDHVIENNQQIEDSWERVEQVWLKMLENQAAFRSAVNKLAEKIPAVFLDIPQIARMESDKYWFDKSFMPVENGDVLQQHLLQNRIFLTPLHEDDAYLFWRFDHFNVIIEDISHPSSEKAIIAGISAIEAIAACWGANCVIVQTSKERAHCEVLSGQGYRRVSLKDKGAFPFLQFGVSFEGTMETLFIKQLPAGIWRLIPER